MKTKDKLFKNIHKAKMFTSIKPRKSGYYWVKYLTNQKMDIAQYIKSDGWYFIGSPFRYNESDLRYISPTPITIPKRKNK